MSTFIFQKHSEKFCYPNCVYPVCTVQPTRKFIPLHVTFQELIWRLYMVYMELKTVWFATLIDSHPLLLHIHICMIWLILMNVDDWCTRLCNKRQNLEILVADQILGSWTRGSCELKNTTNSWWCHSTITIIITSTFVPCSKIKFIFCLSIILSGHYLLIVHSLILGRWNFIMLQIHRISDMIGNWSLTPLAIPH